MSDSIDKAVQVHPLNLAHYLHEDIHTRMDHIMNLNYAPRSIDETHCRKLAESFHSYK